MNTKHQRFSRSATSYARLAAKAARAGDFKSAERYDRMADKFRRMADRFKGAGS